MIIRSDENVHKELILQGDQFKIKHVERVPDGLLKANYENRKDKDSVKSADGEYWLTARIPSWAFMNAWKQYPEFRSSDPDVFWPFYKKWINLPENEVFKTYAGGL